MTLDDVVFSLDQLQAVVIVSACIFSFFKGFATGNSF